MTETRRTDRLTPEQRAEIRAAVAAWPSFAVNRLPSWRVMAVIQCAYDQQPAVVAHDATRRTTGDNPAAVLA